MREGATVDMHHNLLYSYRGPNIDDADRDRQLENNLTKALINTLSFGGESVSRPFLVELGLADARHPDFLLQRRDLPSGGAATKRQRMLLGISKEKAVWPSSEDMDIPYESVPDAWLYGDGFAVLVESKVDGGFLPGQMQGHLGRLRSNEGVPPTIMLKTWGEIHAFFRALLPSLTDAVPRLLVAQLTQFLEFSGMTGFTGFRPDHFDYFILHDNDDARRWVRDQVDDFAAQVVASLHGIAPFYEEHDVGVLKFDDAYCWVAFGPRDKSYRSVTHQSLSLTAVGLEVFVNAELKSATDRIKEVLNRSAAQFRSALEYQHRLQPFELIVQKRTQRQASLFDYTPQLRLHSSMLVDNATSDIAWKAFEDTMKVLPLPYLRIERGVPRTTLLELSSHEAPGVVQHVVELLLRNDPVVRLLNT
jgi:hypothetical protein